MSQVFPSLFEITQDIEDEGIQLTISELKQKLNRHFGIDLSEWQGIFFFPIDITKDHILLLLVIFISFFFSS